MVFLTRPAAFRRFGLLPTFRRAAGPIPRIFAKFSADLQGASTANLENLKSSLVWSEKTLCFRGESLEVANGYHGWFAGCSRSVRNIIYIIVSNG